MNEPHVQAIYYRIESKENVDYKNAPAIIEETDDFIITVDNNEVIFQFKTHFSSASDARKMTDDFINSWEGLWCINRNGDVID